MTPDDIRGLQSSECGIYADTADISVYIKKNFKGAIQQQKVAAIVGSGINTALEMVAHWLEEELAMEEKYEDNEYFDAGASEDIY